MTMRYVVAATALPSLTLRLRFDDGTEGEVSVAAIVTLNGVFAPLSDPSFFGRVKVSDDAGTVVWPNGADLDPLVLYAHATGRDVDDLLATEDALTS